MYTGASFFIFWLSEKMLYLATPFFKINTTTILNLTNLISAY